MCLFIQIFSICMLLNIYTHTSTELWYLYTKEKKRIKYNHISVIIDHKLNYAEYYINVITRRHKLLNNITPAIIFVWRSRDTSHLCLGCEVCYYHFFNEEQKAHGEASLSNYASCISMVTHLWTCDSVTFDVKRFKVHSTFWTGCTLMTPSPRLHYTWRMQSRLFSNL